MRTWMGDYYQRSILVEKGRSGSFQESDNLKTWILFQWPGLLAVKRETPVIQSWDTSFAFFPEVPKGVIVDVFFKFPKHFQTTLYFSHPVGFWLLPSLCAVRELSSVFFPTSDLQRRFRWLVQRGGGEREGATLGSKKPSVMTQLVSIYTWARRIFPTDLILLGEFYEKELYLNFFQTQLILHFWNFWKAEATLESLVSERTRPQSRCRVSCVKQTQSFHVSYIHFERTLLGMVVLTFELLKFCCYWSITKKAFCSL